MSVSPTDFHPAALTYLDGSLYGSGMTPDAWDGLPDSVRDGYDQPAPIFRTEQDIVETTGFTAATVHRVFGPPIPAGVVWSEPVWSTHHVEHIERSYLRSAASIEFQDGDEKHGMATLRRRVFEDPEPTPDREPPVHAPGAPVGRA